MMFTSKKIRKVSETLLGLLVFLLLSVLLLLCVPCDGCSPEETMDEATRAEVEFICEGEVRHQLLSPDFQPTYFTIIDVELTHGLWRVRGEVRDYPGSEASYNYLCTARCYHGEDIDLCTVESVTVY